jgi:hypothetical protein
MIEEVQKPSNSEFFLILQDLLMEECIVWASEVLLREKAKWYKGNSRMDLMVNILVFVILVNVTTLNNLIILVK